MAFTSTNMLQAAVMLSAAGYLVFPSPFESLGNQAIAHTGRVSKQVAKHVPTEAMAHAVQAVLSRLLGLARPQVIRPDGVSGLDYGSEAQSDETEDTTAGGETTPVEGGSLEPETFTEAWDSFLLFRRLVHHRDNDVLAPVVDLPPVSKAEVEQILARIEKRRTQRHEQMQRSFQRHRFGVSSKPEETCRKKSKKTVRFALDTKPGSAETPITPEDKLISPIAPPADTELNYFSACISVPDGSVFTHTYDFDEAALIRRLPSQMKNGAGGLAYCRGRTDLGLYMLDTPAKRLLLDLRAGVCYDGGNGRMLTTEDVIVCMLWGRGSVEERWGGFRWSRGLEGK